MLAACAPARIRHDTLRVALGDDPGKIDPATGYSVPTWSIDKLLFGSLVDYDDAGRIVPDLAATWSVEPDRLVFHLRHGLRFSNGAVCRADDVVASMDRLLRPQTRCPVPRFYSAIAGADAVIAGRSRHIAGLTAPDPFTVEMRLVRPDPFLLQVLAMPFCAVLPHGELDPQHPIGTGPFALTRWIHGQQMIFDRARLAPDPHSPRRVEFELGLSEQVEDLKFERGELDLLGVHRPIDGPDFVRLLHDPKWKSRFVAGPEMATYYIGMNTEMPPFNDVRVRKAVAFAVDRARLVQLLNGRAVIASGFLPPGLPGIDQSLERAVPRPGRAAGSLASAGLGAPAASLAPAGRRDPLYDVAEARALLAQAGHPDGITATYYCPNSGTATKLAMAIQQDLAGAGIHLILKPLSFPTFLTAVGQRRNVKIFQGNWVADYPDPSNFLVPLFSSADIQDVNSRNTTFFHDPAYDALLARAAAEPSAARRDVIYRQAERELMAQMPVAPLFHPENYVLVQPWVYGFRLHPVWPLAFWDICLGAPCRPNVAGGQR